jgi:Flp pilus assembly protein TadD
VLTHWALVALEQGNLADAESKLIKAIERNPRNPHAWHNLGLVCIRGGQPQDGIPHIQRALELKPDFGQAWSNLALAWRETEDLDQALVAARRATELKSGHARVWVILADLLVDAGQFDAADQALYRAASLDPDDAGAEIARAKWASALGDHARARQAFGRALILEPDHPEAQGGLGQLELLCGRFDIGWDLYEARQRTLNRPVRSFGHPVWSGESLQGKTLLVHAEQGLGDNILFASCLPDVIHQARSVVLETAPTLAALFSRSFPGAHVVGRDPRDPSREWLSRLPPVDMEITAGSLPRWTRRDMASFPARQAYLQADPQRVAQRREELQQFGQGPWIGIAWRGGMVRTAGVQRSIDLVTVLRPLQGLPVRWVSLQYGEVGDELQAAAQDTGIAVHHIPDSMRDQDEAAALTSALDGVVTVCQTQAHLTGALGRPGWVLVPSNPNWRYGWQGTSTPWYPSLTLVRQKLHGDWTEVLGELRLELEQCLMSEIAGR